jgi:hypothetical protein
MTGKTDRPVAGLPWRTAAVYLALFVAAFIIYGILWRDTPFVDGDSSQYQEVAKDLADLRLDTLHDRTIGYPLLLALTGSIERATPSLLAISLLLHLASIWLLALVLQAAGVGRRWLLVFGCLLVLPPFVEPAAWVMTENLAQFTLVAGFACLVLGFTPSRIAVLSVSALAFGYAALTRPVYQALAFALSGALLVLPSAFRWARFAYRDAARAACVLVAGSILVLGGMSYVNYVKFNYFGVVPSIGFHLCTKTMSFVERLPDEYAAAREILVRERDAELVKRGGLHSGSQAIWSVRSELSAATGLSKPELSGYLLRMNLWLIRRSPLEYLQEVARSMAGYWFPPATPLASLHSRVLRWLWGGLYAALAGFFFVQLVVLAGVAIFEASARLSGARARALVPWASASAPQALSYVLAGGIVFYTMLLSCLVDIGDPRQRRPTDVLVVFMCVLGAHVWQRCIAAARSQGPGAVGTV